MKRRRKKMSKTTYAKVPVIPGQLIDLVVIENSSADSISYDIEVTNKGHLILRLASAGKKK